MWWMTAAIWILWSIAPEQINGSVPESSGSLEFSLDEMTRAMANLTCVANSCIFNEIHPFAVSKKWRESISQTDQLLYFCECRDYPPSSSPVPKDEMPPRDDCLEALANGMIIKGCEPWFEPAQPLMQTDSANLEKSTPKMVSDDEEVEGSMTASTSTATTTTTSEPPTPCPTTPFPEETLPWQQVWAIVEYLAYLDSGTGISDGSTPLSGDKEFDGRTHQAFCYFCQTGWTLLNQEGANQTMVNGLPKNGTFYGKYPGDNQTKQCNETDICKDYQMDAWKTDCLPTTTTTKKPEPTRTEATKTTRPENDGAPTTTTATTSTRSPTTTTTGRETTTSTTFGTTTSLRKTTKMDWKTSETTMRPTLPWETTTSSAQTSQPTSAISEILPTTTTVEKVERSSSTTVTPPATSSTTKTTDPTTTTTSTNSVGTSEASTTTEEPWISTTTETTTTAFPDTTTTSTVSITSVTTPDQTTTTPLSSSSLLPTPSETSTSSTYRSDSSTASTGTMSSEWTSLSSFVASTGTSVTTETSTVASSTSVGTSTMETTDISTKSTTATVTEPETTGIPSTETSSTDLKVTDSTSPISSTTATSPEISSTAESSSTVLSTTTTRQTTTTVGGQEMTTTTDEIPSTTATPSSSSSTTSPSPSPAVIFTDSTSTSRPESSPVDKGPSVTSSAWKTTPTVEPWNTGTTSPPMETTTNDERLTTERTSTSSGHTSSPFPTSSEKMTAQSTTSTSPPSVTSGVPSRSTPVTSPSTSSVPPAVASSSTEMPASLTNPPTTKDMESSPKASTTSSPVETTSSTKPATTTTDGDRPETTGAGVPTTSSSALSSSSTPPTTSSRSPSSIPTSPSTSPSSLPSSPSSPHSSSSPSLPTPTWTSPETPTSSSKTISPSSTSTGPKSTPSPPGSSPSTPSTRRPGTTTASSKTTPPEWRDCDKVCPPGYEEGDNYCYHLIPPYHAAMYTYSLSYCNRNFSIDLADATDFESSTNLALFRTMNASAEMFWINEHRSKALMTTYKVSLVNVTNSTAFRLATNLVRVQARSNMSNGLCRAPKFCAPVNCSISEIYSLIGYLMPPVPDYLPSQFDAGVTFNQPCLPPATNNVTTTCSHFGQWEPHQSRLEYAPLPQKPEKITYKNKPVRESCDDCHPRGTDNCTEVEGGYKCNCKAGWTKFTCWRSPDHCRKNSCNGHGKCHRMVDTVLCECDQYHSGPTCKKKLLESTWFGENDTVAIISAGTVTAGIYTGNNMLILALKAATKFVTLKEGADPMEQFQQLRVFCLALAGLAVAMFAQPSMFLLNPLMQKMAFFLEQALFGLAFLFYFSEAKQVYWTISGFNRNEWHRDSKKQRHWYLGFLLRNHMPLVAVYAVAAVIAQLSFDRVANYQTTMGLFDEVNSLPMLILVIFHGGFALCAVGAGYDAYRLLKTRPDFYMEICYQAELNKKYIEQDEVRKVGRNVIFMMINPLVLAVSWIALCLSYYLDNVYLDVLCLLLGGLYSVCSTAQSLITHSGNFETLLIKVVFRWLPDWKWLPRVTPLSRLTREEVQCAYQKKRLSSIEYPFQPTLDYWYLRDEERYWIHRNLTQKYCEQRFKTGNTPNECIHTVTLDELTKAFDCDDQEMIYWIGIWAEQIRRHDRFDIRQSRDIINRPQDIMYRAMMAPLMTEGMKKEEERKCQRYQDLADLLKYTEVDQKDVKMPVNRLPGASWIEWLSFNGPVRLRPIFPQYVLREQHALTFRAADKILEMLESEGPGGEDDYNNWLFDEERPGFIGPHKDADFRYFPGAREMLDCWGASKPFRDEMKRLEESRDRWIREEVTGVIEPDRPAAAGGGENGAAPGEDQPGEQGAAENDRPGGEEIPQEERLDKAPVEASDPGIEEPTAEEKLGPSGVETN